MTARIVSVPPKLQLSVRSWFNDAPTAQDAEPSFRWKRFSRKPFFEHENSEKFQAPDESQPTFWGAILESLPNGMVILSQTLEPLYWTSKARSLCERLRQPHEADSILPIVLTEFCEKFLREAEKTAEPLLMEYHGDRGDLIRAQVQWISLGSSESESYLRIWLEDCSAMLLEERYLEQKKYELTDREAEVWILLRQEYSYQEIADLLNISMNTVKTHVKKVYAKRKNLARARKIWYSR